MEKIKHICIHSDWEIVSFPFPFYAEVLLCLDLFTILVYLNTKPFNEDILALSCTRRHGHYFVHQLPLFKINI